MAKLKRSAGKSSVASAEVVVGDNTHPAHSNAAPPPWKRRTAKQYALAAIAATVVAVAIAAYVTVHHRKQPSYAGVVCGDTTSKDAAVQNKLANITTFGQLIAQIESRQHYAQDPNCLYAIAEYRITAGELPTAKRLIAQIKTLYNPKHPFNKYLDDGQASIANLQKQYDIMQQAENNNNGNIDPGI